MNQIQLTNEQVGKIVAGLLFTGLFIYAYTVYFWIPTSKAIEANSSKSAAMERDIAMAKKQKASCPDLEVKLAGLKKQKEEAKKQLPGARLFPDLIRTVTKLSSKHKISIQNIAPGGSTTTQYFVKMTYRISAAGNYHDIGRFLTALGLQVRIMTVENLSLNGTPDGEKGTATASFTLATYQYTGKS